MTGASDVQHHDPSIRQPRPGRFHPLTQLQQIAREATIMERTHVHSHGLSPPGDPPRYAEERCQPLPGGVGPGGLEVVELQAQVTQLQTELKLDAPMRTLVDALKEVLAA
jgi:hypothetical protein